MTSNTIAEIKNVLFLMLLTKLITTMAGGAGIGTGIVVRMAGRALPISLTMIQREEMVESGIAEICRVLVTRTTGSWKMVWRWLMAGGTILTPNKAVIKAHILEIGSIYMTGSTRSRKMIGGRCMTGRTIL
jgi:hypothetical protein